MPLLVTPAQLENRAELYHQLGQLTTAGIGLIPALQMMQRNPPRASMRTPLAELWRHPLHTRELGSQITNVLRCLYLEAWGYQVTVTELVGWEHSMKNELILASRPATANAGKTRAAQTRLQQVLDELGLGELTARFGVVTGLA